MALNFNFFVFCLILIRFFIIRVFSFTDFSRFLFKIVYTTVKVFYQVSKTSRNFLCTLSRLPAVLKTRAEQHRNLGCIKLKYGSARARTDADIRVIVSVVRPCQPRDLRTLQIVVMGEWKYLLKSWRFTSELLGCIRTRIAINRTYTESRQRGGCTRAVQE